MELKKHSIEKGKERWKPFFQTLVAQEPEVGTTPRESIWKLNKTTLWYYPSNCKKFSVPLFLIYSLVNQPFILDLGPGNSLIQSFNQNGYDVYLIDFGIPGYEDRHLTLTDYVGYIQKGVKRVLQHSHAEEITLMGFCLGGTLAAIYASISEDPIKNLILSVAPIDFHSFPLFSKWVDALREGKLDLDHIVDVWGIIPSQLMEAGVRLITYPVYYSPYLALLNRAHDERYTENWRRFNHWTKSHIPFPSAALKQMVNDLIKENRLVKGGLFINNKEVKLSNIQGDFLTIVSKFDKLVPNEMAQTVIDLVGSKDKTLHLLEGGHTNMTEKGKMPGYLAEWLASRSNPIY